MVNNQKKRSYYLRPFLIFTFFITVCNSINAQKITKYYTSSMQENGMLYYIEPKQEFKNKKEHCKFSYDLTFLSTKDTVSLNFTYSDNIIREIDSISFIQAKSKRLSSNAAKIFIETNKSQWNHRYSSKFSLNDLDLIFKQKEKVSILIFYKGNSVMLEIKKREWKKKSYIISKIIALIKANKKSP